MWAKREALSGSAITGIANSDPTERNTDRLGANAAFRLKHGARLCLQPPDQTRFEQFEGASDTQGISDALRLAGMTFDPFEDQLLSP